MLSLDDEPVAPTLDAGTLAGQAINVCLSAAAMHLGEPDDRGRRLAAPQPGAAWLAILAADALIFTVTPFVDETLAGGLGQALGSLVGRFAERYPEHEAPMPPSFALRWAQAADAATGAAPVPEAAAAPAAGTGRLPADPVDVDHLVHTIFKAFVSVAGYNMGDALPNSRRLPNPDVHEARLCLGMAGALYAQLFAMLGQEPGEIWRRELDTMLTRFQETYPEPERPVASLEAVIAEAWAEVEA